MKPHILLANLQALLARMPDWDAYNATSREHMTWLGQAYALTSEFNQLEGGAIRVGMGMLTGDLLRANAVEAILAAIHRVIATLELRVPDAGRAVFGEGDVYDYFTRLSEIIASADVETLIIDPYLDETILDQYVAAKKDGVSVRLLTQRYTERIRPAAEAYIAQHGPCLALRNSDRIHDRVVFTDRRACWVLGQSVKDAARAKPTYIAPLAPDVVILKLGIYEAIWNDATIVVEP